MRSLLLASLLTAGLVQNSLAVGQYLDRGQSGVSPFFQMLFADGDMAIGGGLGYSHLGLVDVQAGYSRASTEEGEVEMDMNEYAVGLMGHPLKESASIPLSLSLEATYAHIGIASDELDDLDIEASANAYALGAVVHRTLDLSDKLAVQAGAGYTWASITFEFGDEEDDETSNSFPLHLAAIFSPNASSKVVLSPSLELDEDENTFGVQLSYIFILP